MSDSDDTDVLLLIPPDFFFVAPSPSPVSSPSTISPPPISKSTFKQKIPLTEELARKSLKEITSKLKVIDRRLSLIESQHSDSMDGEHSSNWLELESNASGSTRFRPLEVMENGSDRRSTNVQELIQASVRDPRSVMAQKRGALAQSWVASGREAQYLSTQRARSSSNGRDGTSQAKAFEGKDEDSDEEGREELRQRRSSSLPPTPSSHLHHKKIGDYSESTDHKMNPSYRRGIVPAVGGFACRLGGELARIARRKNMEEVGGRDISAASSGHADARFGGLESDNMEHQNPSSKGTEKSRGDPFGRSEWGDRRVGGGEQLRWDHERSLAAEGEESFNMNLSGLDGTLGVSAILPSLSSLGLGTSAIQGTLDLTKESCSSTGGGVGGGLSLSEVERLLEDMHHTQVEMERSMRRGRAQLQRRSVEGKMIGSRKDAATGESDVRAELDSGDHRGAVANELNDSVAGKKDVGLCKEGLVRGEVQRREGWLTEGKSEVSTHHSKSSPVKIIVDELTKKSQPMGKSDDAQGNGSKPPSERGVIEGQSARDGSLIYRSKSDESLTGGQGKSSRGKAGGKYLGVDSSDDSLFSSGPITSSHITRLGDTLGSVPDLGLGVRELFAKPEELRQPVKEPPCVKKDMFLLGSSQSHHSDAPSVTSQGNVMALKSFAKSPGEGNTFGLNQISSRDADKQVWPMAHISREAGILSQTHGQGNNSTNVDPFPNISQANTAEQQIPCVTPQKYLFQPHSSAENRENLGRDARRQLHFEKMKQEEQELNSAPRGSSASSRPPVRDGGEDNASKGVGSLADGESKSTDQGVHSIPSSNGPVLVVGGEGRPRKRRKDGGGDAGGWEGGGDGRQTIGGGIRPERSQGSHWWSKGAGMSRVHGSAWNEGRRQWATRNDAHRSLDEHLIQSRGGKLKDSDFHDGGPQSFPWDPTHGGHRYFTESDMWVPPHGPGKTAAEEIITLRRKLEEERFRREHCERVIEEVGRRALESQERLAVSQGLSKAKDIALGKFREAWEEAVSGWKREGEARYALEEEVDRYRDRVDAEIAFRDERQKQLETELVRLGAESSSLREELRKGQRETADVTARLSCMLEEATKEVTACRKESESASLREARAQDAAAKAEDTAKDALKKLDEATNRANSTESEKCMMKQEMETLQGKLRDCMSRVATLEGRLADAEVAADTARKNEKKASEERMIAQQELDKERLKLKEFYQSQVEELVKSKVNEFQGQLDAIELSLRKEAETREEQAKRQGEERLKLLSQKHSQEVSLLEQKHKEELSLWGLRLKRAVAEAENLKAQVSRYNSKKAQLAKGLHSLMQAQLKEGLRLIASGGEGVDNESFSSPPKKLEKKLSPAETSWRDVMASLNFHETSDIVPENDLIPKKDTDQDLGYSSMIKEKTGKDIITSGSKSSVPNNDLKKYINMLLDREPGKPVNLMEMGNDSDDDIETQLAGVKHRQQMEMKDIRKPVGIVEGEKVNVKERKGPKKTKRKESEGLSKQSRDSQWRALWEPMEFKLSEPSTSGQIFESEKCELEGQRYRKPPWK